MDRRRAAGALLALAACIACSTAAPTASNQTALELLEGPSEGCYYNFQHYGEGDRIMTNEPCLNCTCHNRMLMCYLKVCPFTKPIGQDCTIEKRADQCCPIVTCPDVPVDLLTSTSTSSPAEYGATGLGKVDKYGCSINGKYFPEGSKVPPTPNKPCEHCYCIRNMTTCVMQECTLHVDGCTPIYHKDVCCPVRYSCDHLEDGMLLLDDMTTTVRPTPGFLLTTTTMPSVTQISQNCVHDDQIFADGALIKTEIACEHCYCMKGDIVCVVQECGTPMENEGKNCTSLPPRQGQCCPDTYICEGDELSTELTTGLTYEELTTLSPPRRVEGSGYRNEPDEPYTDIPTFEGSGEEHATTLDSSDMFTSQKQTPQIIDEIFAATEESLKPSLTTIEPDKEQNTVPDDSNENTSESQFVGKTTIALEATTIAQPTIIESMKDTETFGSKTTISDYHPPSEEAIFISKDDEFIMTTESASHYTKDESKPKTTQSLNIIDEVTTQQTYQEPSSSEASILYKEDDKTTNLDISEIDKTSEPEGTTPVVTKDDSEDILKTKDKQDLSLIRDKEDTESLVTTTAGRIELPETTSVNPFENEIDEDILPPGRIPGEGDCLLNGITYKNNTNVPNINNCHSSCKCMSSIVKCDPIICSPPPKHMDNMNDCQPIYDTPDACCPTYVCHSRETIPPESHNQMSGTESPKPSHESECLGDQCQPHKTKPIPTELCASDDCKPEIGNQEKECKNGSCEYIETITSTPPLKYPESCDGPNCVPSVESCTDEKCRQTTTSETVCDNENGCQPSEACEGNNCVTGSEIPITTDELSICKDSEECKVSDTSDCKGSKCDKLDEDTQVPNKNIPSECTEESCRRKELPQENKSPTECSGPSCSPQEGEDVISILTTESATKSQINKESTTEIINDDYSKSPELEETSAGETQKTPQVEAITENQNTTPERSTEKLEDLSEGHLNAAEKEGYYTDGSELHVTKLDEPITEIYNKQETYETITLDNTSRGVTESIQHVSKETSTESSFTTQYEEHSSDEPKEDISVPMKLFEASTETLDIDHEKNQGDGADTDIIEEFTQTQETSTRPTNILATTSKLLETEVSEQEYTKKQEIFTESPEEYSTLSEETIPHVTEKQEPTKIVIQDSETTESQPEISMTESFITLLPEMSTEKRIDFNIKDNDITSTDVPNDVTNIHGQFTTEQSFEDQQSSEPHETKLDETATNKIYSETEKDHTSTEKPNVFTEVVPTETTVHELYKEEEPQSTQKTDMESPHVNVDSTKQTTESSVTEQEKFSQSTEAYDTVTDKQDIYTTPDEIQEYVTSVSSVIHSTQPSETEENMVTEVHEIPISQKGESNTESSIKESPTSTITQHFDMKEITTQEPAITEINIQEVTTETLSIHDVPSETVPDILEEHTDTSIKDFIEVSITTPKVTFQEDTTHKESSVVEPQEVDTTTNMLQMDELKTTSHPIPAAELDTTISSILSDKDKETSTKYTEVHLGIEPNVISTLSPDIPSTKLDEFTSLSAESEEKISDSSTSSRVESEGITTESLKHPYEDKSEMPNYMQTNVQTDEPSLDEISLAPTVSYTESHADSDDKTTPVPIDEIKEKPLYTTSPPDTIKQVTEKQDTTFTDKDVTESVEIDHTSLDSNEDIHKPTEYSISTEKEIQNIVTHASETTTKSQDAETKLVAELQTNPEISTIPAHVIKDETGQTESPMSLITETSVSLHSDDIGDSIVDKTTPASQVNMPDEEEISSPEYTTVKVFDNLDIEKTSPTTENTYLDVSTKVVDKLAPATDYQDTILTQNPIEADSESYLTDILHEFTSVAPVIVSSEQSLATEKQEISTVYPEISGSMTTLTYNHEQQPENIPVKEHTLEDATEQTQNNVGFTTSDSKTSETLKDHDGAQQEHDIVVTVQDDDHTVPPELFTTKYPETLDKTEDKQTDQPIKQEEHTLAPELNISTEGIISTGEPVSPHIEIQNPMDQDQDKSTEIIHTSDEKIVTTSEYHDSTTLPTESSEMLPSEENNRRTLSPGFETIQPEQHTTEKQKITELPEIIKTYEKEQTDTTQEISSDIPEKESVTLIPQTTESDVLLQTQNPYQDQKLPVITESINKPTSEVQDVTLKPVTVLDVSEDLHTELPLESITEINEMTKKPTVHDDLIKIPVDALPVDILSEFTVAQESQTETSIPKETVMSEQTETEVPISLETGSDISVPIVTESSISKATEPSIPKETEAVVSKVTEASVPEETEDSILEVTKVSEHKVTESAIPEESEYSVAEVTKAFVPEGTEAIVPEVTEASVHKVTETSVLEETENIIPDVTEASIHKVTEFSVPEETEVYMHKVTETSIYEETEATVPKVTEVSVPKETETSIPKETEASIPKETEASNSKETETSVPKETVAPVPKETEAFEPEVTAASVPEMTETSVTESSKSGVPEVTEASKPEVTEASKPEVTEASKPEVTEASKPEVTEASISEVTKASAFEITKPFEPETLESSVPEATKSTEPEITESSVPEITKASVSEVTDTSAAEITEASVAEITEPSPPVVTEVTLPKETESGIVDKEPQGTTFKPKDELTEIPVEQSSTLEALHSSSETTPYIIVQQEHTTKVDEDISSITLNEEDRTKAPETYQTERGDQPIDSFQDKFTQEDFNEEHTTKETFTKKDEQLTTLPHEQDNEYPQKIPDKTEVTTEEILISPESPTLSDAQIGQHTTSSGEQSVTISPTASITLKDNEKFTTAVFEVETTSDKKDLPLYTEKIPEHEIIHEATLTKATTIKTPEEIATHPSVVDDKFTKPEDKPSESYSPTAAPELSKPGVNEIQPTEEIPPPDFPSSGSSGYGQESDYGDEEQAFGPGTCRYGGKVYVSAQQIPRDDPCDFCFCFRSDIICLQQSCPPPIHGCHEEPIQGFCCPRYECPVSMATTLNVTTTTTTTTTTLPPHFLPHAYKGAAQRRGCQIKGHSYKVGEVVRASSGPCLHCTCGGDGQMKCDPKACTPEPMLRQMIAAAVSAKRRR